MNEQGESTVTVIAGLEDTAEQILDEELMKYELPEFV